MGPPSLPPPPDERGFGDESTFGFGPLGPRGKGGDWGTRREGAYASECGVHRGASGNGSPPRGPTLDGASLAVALLSGPVQGTDQPHGLEDPHACTCGEAESGSRVPGRKPAASTHPLSVSRETRGTRPQRRPDLARCGYGAGLRRHPSSARSRPRRLSISCRYSTPPSIRSSRNRYAAGPPTKTSTCLGTRPRRARSSSSTLDPGSG